MPQCELLHFSWKPRGVSVTPKPRTPGTTTFSRSRPLTLTSSATTTRISLTVSRWGHVQRMCRRMFPLNVKNVHLSAGFRWQNLWTSKGLPGLVVSHRAWKLPDCPQHLHPPFELLHRGKSVQITSQIIGGFFVTILLNIWYLSLSLETLQPKPENHWWIKILNN